VLATTMQLGLPSYHPVMELRDAIAEGRSGAAQMRSGPGMRGEQAIPVVADREDEAPLRASCGCRFADGMTVEEVKRGVSAVRERATA
jgi:hypothetical protein